MFGRKDPPRDAYRPLRDDEPTLQVDDDPYLATLARQGRLHRAAPPPRGPRIEGPLDDGDLYLATLARSRYADKS
jgi:hypothetical protein